MPSETSDLFSAMLESSRHPVTDNIDPSLLLPRFLNVQINSGIQSVWANNIHALNLAKRFKPPFREFAIEMVMADIQGIISLCSEGGFNTKEFSMSRSNIPQQFNQGPAVNWLDQYYYENLKGEKDKFKNNPKTDDMGLNFTGK